MGKDKCIWGESESCGHNQGKVSNCGCLGKCKHKGKVEGDCDSDSDSERDSDDDDD